MKNDAPAQTIPSGARDRMRASAHPIFAEQILTPIFEFNCRHFFAPLLAANRAWLTMLVECGIVKSKPAKAIFKGLDEVEAAGPDAVRPFDPAVEYYYLHMERALVGLVLGGEAVVGDLNLGRTRPEPLARMVIREKLLHNVGYMDTEEVELECILPLFDCFTSVEQTLPTIGPIVRSMQPNRELMYTRAEQGFSSVTALAEKIHSTQHISYRSAHRVVARAVLLAVEEDKTATQIDAHLLNRAAQDTLGRSLALTDATIGNCLNPGTFVRSLMATGAASPAEVERRAADRRLRLLADCEKIDAREQAIRNGEAMLAEAVTGIMASA